MPSNILVSDKFLKMLDKLTTQQQKQAEQKIALLAENPRHPSLKAHRLTAWKEQGFWECYINDGDRLIYRQAQGALELHAVGKHAIIDSFYAPAQNEPMQLYKPAHSQASQPPQLAQPAPTVWHSVQPSQPRSENPFRHLPPTHLRILGVPAALVSAVQKAEHIEDLEELPLPYYVQDRLLELATNAELADLVFEQGRLLYRTTLDKLHGYIEGSIKRLMLNLTPEQERYANLKANRPILLRGCAGSGKTTIAIYRAIQQAETGKPVLFLTYTKTLANAARTLIEELIGPLPENLEVTHIDAWLSNFLARRGKRLTFSNNDSRRAALRAALAEVQQLPAAAKLLATIPEREREPFFRDEILTVIKAQGITHEAAYLKASRVGRGKALREAERRVVWQVYQAYRKHSAPYVDWDDLAIDAYDELQRHPYSHYTHVIVDEVQDLSPIKLRVILKLIESNTSQHSLFFVGDVAQTIYSRGFAWKDLGLEMRGSSYSLRRNFRNTREIAQAAARLNEQNLTLKASEHFVDPEPIDRHGPRPILIECDTTDREQRAVREKILELIEGQHFRLSDFAILAPTNDLSKAYKTALDRVSLPCAIHSDSNFNILEEQVKILTIHSAKGLEFPVVFVVGLHESTLPRQPYNIPAEEHALHFERERTLLYVAMTRASEGLFLVTSQQSPSRFLREIEGMVHTEPFIGS